LGLSRSFKITFIGLFRFIFNLKSDNFEQKVFNAKIAELFAQPTTAADSALIQVWARHLVQVDISVVTAM
jgi:hypothetical protein